LKVYIVPLNKSRCCIKPLCASHGWNSLVQWKPRKAFCRSCSSAFPGSFTIVLGTGFYLM